MVSFLFWGILLAICALANIVVVILVCWCSGWPILMESLGDNMLCWSFPLLELVASIICFIIAGIQKLRR